MWRRLLGTSGALLVLCGVPAQADKLPVDQGLQVSLKPGITRMKVGQVVDFHMTFTDDDAASAEGSIDVQAVGGTGFAADGACDTPLQRRPMAGGADARAVFKKPGRYVVRAMVSSSTCSQALTGAGGEHVVVARTITVAR